MRVLLFSISPFHALFALCSTAILLMSISICNSALALEDPGTQLQEVGLVTELGRQVDLSLQFTDAEGKERKLSEFFTPGRPVIIVPSYYNCPRLCGLVLDGVVELLNQLEMELGTDFQVLTVSFAPSDLPEHARLIRDKFYARFDGGKQEAAKGWEFLTGEAEPVEIFMEQIGFKYIPDDDDIAHTAAIMLLTPEGEISQYFGGIAFPKFDVRLAIVEASEGKVGSALDQILLFCFQFDPIHGRYTLFAMNLVRLVGALTLVGILGLLWNLWSKDRVMKF